MWCPNCKADVAAEVAADNRRVRCATCGVEISASAAFTGLAKTREARDLLERWASERKVDSPPRSERGAQRTADSQVTGGVSLEEDADSVSTASRPDRRAAPAMSPVESARPAAVRSGYRIDPSQPMQGPSGQMRRAVPRSESARLHRQHESSEGSPHFDIQGSLLGPERKRTNWTSILGQLIAYAGVALLTIGTTLIVWSYFGGPANSRRPDG